MANDEYGMPVPHSESPLPWSASGKDEWAWVKTETGNGNYETGVCEPYFRADADFIVHSANWIIPCREIVRRLSVWYDECGSVSFNVIEVSRDAAKLWADMQRDAKRGDDVH